MIQLLSSMLVRVPANQHLRAAGAAARALPPALLQRRLDKSNSVAESAIKEKEAMQKNMDEMRAELELAKSNLGDTVQVAHNPASTPARKVCLVPLETF